MTVLNFPPTTGEPTDGSFQYTENNITYVWNGSYWASANANSTDFDSRYLNSTGPETFTGDLTITGDLDLGVAQGSDTTAITAGTLYIITGNSNPASPGQFTGAGAPDGNIGTTFLATGTVTLTGGNTVATAASGGDISTIGDITLTGDLTATGDISTSGLFGGGNYGLTASGDLRLSTTDISDTQFYWNQTTAEGAFLSADGVLACGREGDAGLFVNYITGNNLTDTLARFVRDGGDGSAAGGEDVVVFNRFGDGFFRGDVRMESQNGGPLAGFRNFIINGDFRIWQRGTSFTNLSPFLTLSRYTADNVLVFLTGSSPGDTFQRATVDGSFGISTAFESSVSGGSAFLTIPIELEEEGATGPFIVGDPYTVSFYSTKDDFPLSPRICGTDYKVTAVGGDLSNDWTPVANGTREDIGGGWYRYQQTFTCTACASTARLFYVSATIQDGHQITGFQLEHGSVATPFEHRPIGIELALCKRYYQAFNWEFNAYRSTASADNAQFYDRQAIPFQTPMRIFPNITLVGGQFTGLGYSDFTPSGYVVHNQQGSGFAPQFVATQGNYRGSWTLSAEL